MSLMSQPTPQPVVCLCDGQDGEKTTVLGFEKGKKDLTHYKVTIDGPIKSNHSSIQMETLKSGMDFLTDKDEVSSAVAPFLPAFWNY